MTNISFGKKYSPQMQNLYFEKAKELANKSICERAKVGAVIVENNDKIIGQGFNSIPEGLAHCKSLGGCPRKKLTKIFPKISYQYSCQSIHAEQNALISAKSNNFKDGTLFLYGIKDICINCKRLLINAKISDFYIKQNDMSPIKHIEIKELINCANEQFAKQIKIIKPFNFLKKLFKK